MKTRKIAEDLDCGINVAMKVFGAKWKPCIIDAIRRGAVRPSEIHRQIPNATPRVLDMQLRELEDFEVVGKRSGNSFPLKTAYYLTPLGESILPVIALLDSWGNGNMETVKGANERLLHRQHLQVSNVVSG